MSEKTFTFHQNNTHRLKFNLYDIDDNVIAKANIATLLCTLYYYNPDITTGDPNHLATINSRYNQDILDANNVTISTTGTVTWYITPEDTVKVDSNSELELHIALITWIYDAEKRQNSQEFNFWVKKVDYAT